MKVLYPQQGHFELCFESLHDPRQIYAFPCDAWGHVDMDQLEERMLCEYLYARTVIGREFRLPSVRRRGEAGAVRLPAPGASESP
jgi:hypothetical protein